jgi:Zn ribbon nucleic-acid-binding protein
MVMYRLRGTDGSLRPVTAGRVVVDAELVRFQSPGTGGWVTVDSAPLAQVSQLDRKVNEASGLLRWVPEREVNAAADAVRPQTAPEPAPAAPESPAAPKPAAARQREPSAAVSARDVRCPQCGEQEELSGRRVDGEVFLTCDSCGYDGPRVARRTCPGCGSVDVVDRPKAVVERSRGTQLSVVGYTTVTLCKTCDADTLAAALSHGGAVMPDELPTVDPRTLREMGRSRPRR